MEKIVTQKSNYIAIMNTFKFSLLEFDEMKKMQIFCTNRKGWNRSVMAPAFFAYGFAWGNGTPQAQKTLQKKLVRSYHCPMLTLHFASLRFYTSKVLSGNNWTTISR